MSREEPRGQRGDAESESSSFGPVLSDVQPAEGACKGSTPASVMGAIMARPAPSIADVAPPVLDGILHRCLEKDPENRWQTARDLHAALALLGQAISPALAPPPSPTRLALLLTAAAARA